MTQTVATAAAKRGVVVGCHLKVDTGMNRLGFRHDNLARTVPAVLASAALLAQVAATAAVRRAGV
ncbi:MAG TPA: alanine racemase, partial [Phycisphaerae bacterium]|nr:alanine racemase [Phycisphaerae bacterium]